MKTLWLYFFVFTMSILHCKAEVPPEIIAQYRLIAKLIKEDNATELSKLVDYPLKREYPLPSIANAKEFITYYPILFDVDFKEALETFDDSVILEHNYMYGLVGGHFNGDIWLNVDGKIEFINYSSDSERRLHSQILKKVKQQLHASINSFQKNKLVARSGTQIIRLDETKLGLRYASWSNGHTMSKRPDIILYGKEEWQGDMGGWRCTFTNKERRYTIDYNIVCDRPANCGIFLEVYRGGMLESIAELKEIK